MRYFCFESRLELTIKYQESFINFSDSKRVWFLRGAPFAIASNGVSAQQKDAHAILAALLIFLSLFLLICSTNVFSTNISSSLFRSLSKYYFDIRKSEKVWRQILFSKGSTAFLKSVKFWDEKFGDELEQFWKLVRTLGQM